MTTNATTTKTDPGIAERLHDAGERLTEAADDAAQRIGKRIDKLGIVMKRHPIATIAIGLGLGYLLARIIHR